MLYIIITTGILVFLLAAVCVAGFVLSNNLLKVPHMSRGYSLDFEQTLGTRLTPEVFASLHKEEIVIPAADGAMLHGYYLPCGRDTDRAMVMAHGFGVNCIRSTRYALSFMERGFDVIVFDHRHAGESTGRFTTMGYHEANDVSLMIDELEKRKGRGVYIGLHGESMGGATVVMTACRDPRVRFAIDDCGYHDLRAQTEHSICREKKLPAFPFIPIGNIACRIRAGFPLSGVSPVSELDAKGGLPDTPILFIHGTHDDYVPTSSSLILHEHKKGAKMLYLCRGATHARSIVVDPARYEAVIDEFFSMAGIPSD